MSEPQSPGVSVEFKAIIDKLVERQQRAMSAADVEIAQLSASVDALLAEKGRMSEREAGLLTALSSLRAEVDDLRISMAPTEEAAKAIETGAVVTEAAEVQPSPA